jgi:hypothetical protein
VVTTLNTVDVPSLKPTNTYIGSGGEQRSEQRQQLVCLDGLARNPQVGIARQLLDRGGGISGRKDSFQ